MSSSTSATPSDFDMYAVARSMARDLLAMVGVTRAAVHDLDALVDGIELTGPREPFVPSPWRISEMMVATHIAFSVLGQVVSRSRLGQTQKASISTAHASMTIWQGYTMFWSLANGSWNEIAAKLRVVPPPEGTYPHFMVLTGHVWRCKDGQWIYLFSSFSPPDAFLRVMGFSDLEIKRLLDLTHQVPDYVDTDWPLTHRRQKEFVEAFRQKVLEWNAKDLEAAYLKAKVGAVICPLTGEEFDRSEQGKALASHPAIEIQKFDGWAPAPMGKLDTKGAERGLLSGIKVLELTRVLMGPTMGLQLANYGATSIRVASPLVQDAPVYDFTMNTNKRAIPLDLKDPKDKARFLELLQDADVLIQNNAYGALERMGLSAQDVFELVKKRGRGIVYVEGSSFGFHGPLASAFGFEQLGQMLAGLCVEQGKHQIFSPPIPSSEAPPTLLPAANCDVNTGSFGALGALAALWRREREGGSYLVRVSLTQTARQLRDFGTYSDPKDIEKLMRGFPPIESDYDPTSIYYGIGILTNFYIKLKDRYPEWFDPTNGMWNTFKNCPWGGR